MNSESFSYTLKSLPEDERPRERFIRHGSEAISTADLIAIILGSGTKGISVLQLARQIVLQFGTLQRLSEVTIEELCQIKGLGPAKAIQLKAAFCLGHRISQQAIPPKYKIQNPMHAYHLVKEELEKEKKELFIVILLDAKSCLICRQVVAVGTLTQSLVHPREVFYPAIRHTAASLILMHNHPSGDPTPSTQDYEITKKLIEVGKVMGIPVNDHLIVGEGKYVSLRQEGNIIF